MFFALKALLLLNCGQGLMEYSLILLFIAVAVIFFLDAVGIKILWLLEYTVNNWPS